VTEEAKRYIEGHTDMRPAIGLVLGSGLGAFADELTERTDIPYADIPGWPHSTAVGHAGKLIIGKLEAGKPGAGLGEIAGPVLQIGLDFKPLVELRVVILAVRGQRGQQDEQAKDEPPETFNLHPSTPNLQ